MYDLPIVTKIPIRFAYRRIIFVLGEPLLGSFHRATFRFYLFSLRGSYLRIPLAEFQFD